MAVGESKRSDPMPQRKKRTELQPKPSMDEDPVVKGILKAISLKRIRPGMKLGEDQLVAAFGSNRIHIRQVLAHLGSRNVITLYPNRGAYVAEPTVEEAHQVFAARRTLEAAAVSELIDRLGEGEETELRHHLERERGHAHDDRWNTRELTGDFHSVIAVLAGNAVLAKFIEELVLRTSLIIAAFEPQGDEDCSPEAHPHIAQLILARDKKAALKAMQDHLDSMERRLQLDAPPKPEEDIASIFADLGVEQVKPRK